MKRLISLLLAIAMVVTMLSGLSITTQAAGSTFATATAITFGNTYESTLTITNDYTDVYKFNLSSSGKVTIDLSAYIESSRYYIYDANGETVWSETWATWNSNTRVYQMNQTIDLTKGNYYFSISKSSYYEGYNYQFKLTFSSASESFAEGQNGSNNSITDADSISLNKTYKGQLALNDDKDLYKFTLESSGKVTISLSAYIENTDYYIYEQTAKPYGLKPGQPGIAIPRFIS